MLNLLHIFPDEPKFFRFATEFFNKPGIVNHWLILTEGTQKNISEQTPNSSYVNSILLSATEVKHKILKEIYQSNICVVHYADHQLGELVQIASDYVPIIIQFWGGDYSSSLIPPIALFEKESYKSLILAESKLQWAPQLLAKSYHFLRWKFDSRRNSYLSKFSSAHRFCFLLGSIESELFPDLFATKALDWKVVYESFCDNEDFVEDPTDGIVNVLLGNSGNISNNHIDALKALTVSSMTLGQCFCPLSYGGSTDSNSKIIKEGYKLLGDKFIPLVDFLPLTVYRKMLASCQVVIMNQIRQQALGNILWALNTGRTVYLNPQGLLSKYFKRHGFYVFDLTDLTSKKHKTLPLVTKSQAEINQLKVREHWANDGLDLENELRQIIDSFTPQTTASHASAHAPLRQRGR